MTRIVFAAAFAILASRLTEAADVVSDDSSSLNLLQKRVEKLPSKFNAPKTASLLTDAFKNRIANDNGKHGQKASGRTVPLSEVGYKRVATHGSDNEMKAFVRRVLAAQGRGLRDGSDAQGWLNGLVPYHSGLTATQTYDQLVDDLHRSSNWTHRLSAFNAEAILAGASGGSVPLTEVGYKVVAAMRSDDEMKAYMRRVLFNHGFAEYQNTAGEAALDDMAPLYSGSGEAERSHKDVQFDLLHAPWIQKKDANKRANKKDAKKPNVVTKGDAKKHTMVNKGDATQLIGHKIPHVIAGPGGRKLPDLPAPPPLPTFAKPIASAAVAVPTASMASVAVAVPTASSTEALYREAAIEQALPTASLTRTDDQTEAVVATAQSNTLADRADRITNSSIVESLPVYETSTGLEEEPVADEGEEILEPSDYSYPLSDYETSTTSPASVSFSSGITGTDLCQTSYKGIGDERSCMEAATALNLTSLIRSGAWAAYPAGCFADVAGNVFVNSHIGTAEAGSTPICEADIELGSPIEYESLDTVGQWWPVTVTAQDAVSRTYSTMLEDGTAWAQVSGFNLRRRGELMSEQQLEVPDFTDNAAQLALGVGNVSVNASQGFPYGNDSVNASQEAPAVDNVSDMLLRGSASVGLYKMGENEANTCSPGYERINDEQMCKEAMGVLGLGPWGRQDFWADHPGGCFRNPGGDVFLNLVAGGGTGKESRALICVATAQGEGSDSDKALNFFHAEADIGHASWLYADDEAEEEDDEADDEDDEGDEELEENVASSSKESSFILASEGTNACPVNYRSISDIQLCKLAMDALAIGPWGREDTWTDHPAGCFQNPSGDVYLNNHTGKGKEGRLPICEKMPSDAAELISESTVKQNFSKTSTFVRPSAFVGDVAANMSAVADHFQVSVQNDDAVTEESQQAAEVATDEVSEAPEGYEGLQDEGYVEQDGEENEAQDQGDEEQQDISDAVLAEAPAQDESEEETLAEVVPTPEDKARPALTADTKEDEEAAEDEVVEEVEEGEESDDGAEVEEVEDGDEGEEGEEPEEGSMDAILADDASDDPETRQMKLDLRKFVRGAGGADSSALDRILADDQTRLLDRIKTYNQMAKDSSTDLPAAVLAAAVSTYTLSGNNLEHARTLLTSGGHGSDDAAHDHLGLGGFAAQTKNVQSAPAAISAAHHRR